MKKSYLFSSLFVLLVGIISSLIGFIIPYNDMIETQKTIIGNQYSYSYYLTNDDCLWITLGALGIAMLLSSVFALLFSKTVLKCCSPITSLIALAISICAGAGLVCFFEFLGSSPTRNPIAYPAAQGGIMICTMIGLMLIVSYGILWFKKMSFRGFLFDVLLSVVYFPGLFFFFIYLDNVLRNIL